MSVALRWLVIIIGILGTIILLSVLKAAVDEGEKESSETYDDYMGRLYEKYAKQRREAERSRMNTSNHGLESTSAPPAAGTLETHP